MECEAIAKSPAAEGNFLRVCQSAIPQRHRGGSGQRLDRCTDPQQPTRTREEPMRSTTQPSRWRGALTAAVLAGVGAGLGFLVARYGIEMPGINARLEVLNGWDLLALPVLGMLAIAIHEAGHLVGGISRGMRFLLYIVGPFQFSQSESGIRFNWAFNMGTLGGVAACMPDPNRPLQPQLRRLVLGGPLTSLLLALACFWLASMGSDRVSAYALIAGLISLTIFAVTAVPMRAGGFMSDGMQYLELLRGGRAVEERNVLTVLMGQSLAGSRPAQLDGALLAQALAFDSQEPLRRVATRLLAFLHAWDRAELKAAAGHADYLASHIDDYPDGFRQALALELSLFAALERDDAAAAAHWSMRARGGVVDGSRRALAEAALARIEGRFDAAEQSIRAARKLLPRSMDRGGARFTADQIETLEQSLHSAKAAGGHGPARVKPSLCRPSSPGQARAPAGTQSPPHDWDA